MNQLRFLFGTLATVFALVASTANAQPALQASSQDDPVRISAELTMHDATSGVLRRAAQRMTGSPTAIQHVSKNAEQSGIPWEPFSQARLEELIHEGKTVFVDFTADWCLTCKANEAVAIETTEVRELLKRNGIIALRADKTEPAPDVDETLRLLGNKAASIPFYAVFPAGRPQQPITLDGIFTSPKPILDALTTAGKSHVKRTVVRADSDKSRRGLTRVITPENK